MVRPYLEINGLVGRYGDKIVLKINNLILNNGEVLAIIGPNGAGKSTLLRMIAHIEKPVAGSIKFIAGDAPISELDIRRKLAMVFQEPLLFTGKVFENIAYGLKVRKLPRDEMKRRVHDIAEKFGISHLLDLPSNRLSGGEAQRVSLARALILRPELLLLDEPMASLDPPTKESLLADLRRILDELDTAIIYVTHERSEAMVLADRLAVMDEGEIVQIGKPDEVMDYPANRKIAGFVGVENILEGDVFGMSSEFVRVKIGNGGIIEAIKPRSFNDAGYGNSDKTDYRKAAWVFIRPENITVEQRGIGETNGFPNHLGGVIGEMVNLGVMYRVVVDCGFPVVAFTTKQLAEAMHLKEDQPVWVSFSAHKVHVISREEERNRS